MTIIKIDEVLAKAIVGLVVVALAVTAVWFLSGLHF